MMYAKRKSSPRIYSLQDSPRRKLAQRPAACGPPPLLIGESKVDYQQLFHGVWMDVKPLGVLEEIIVCDVVDMTWEITRHRRQTAALMDATAHQGLAIFLGTFPAKRSENLKQDWIARDPEAIKEVDDLLKKADLTMDAIRALTLAKNPDQFEQMERKGALLEVRRAALLRELDRHRATLQAIARQLLPELDQLEPRVIEAKPAEGADDQ